MNEEQELKEAWASACTLIKEKSELLYKQWFSKITPLGLDGDEVVLGVPDSFFGEWIQTNVGDILDEAVSFAMKRTMSVRFEGGYKPVSEDSSSVVAQEEKAVQESVPVVEPVQPTEPQDNGFVKQGMTFEKFVVGEENRYAYSATLTAAKSPGVFSPLFIYGGPGMGKTHLLGAVANEVRKNNPNAVVRSSSCEGFLNAYVDSFRNKTHYQFREYYRNADFLLIDDVHHIGGKVQLQEEFFNTFNALYGAGKQIILTSDRPPSEIAGLEARLVSRFVSGVTTQITPPTFETRLAILRQERDAMSVKPGDDILEYIATRITSNIRPLKSALYSLTMFANAMGIKELNLSLAEQVLSDLFSREAETRQVSIEQILKQVSGFFSVPVHELIGSKKPKNIAQPRMIAMYLSRTMTQHSYQEIGQAFGGRNHATVIHAVRQMEDACVKDEDMKRTLSTLQRQIQNVNLKKEAQEV